MAQESLKRRLTAILSADVEGYSRLMRDDEEATICRLTDYRTAMTKLIEQYRGRVVDAPGDNLLAEFGSVVDAVKCAVEVQREMAERNVELPENCRMQFRMGVNLGDVFEEGYRIYGDGVNIAARMENLAEPGGICISGAVYDSMVSKSELEYEYLGEQTVKNIPEPIRSYRVLSYQGAAAHRVVKAKKAVQKKWRNMAVAIASVMLIGISIAVIWNFYIHPSPPAVESASVEKMALPLPDKPSIAVLPFKNLSGDQGQEFFSDGFTEDIITALAQIPRMFVIARESSFTYKGKSVTIQEIGRDLGVQYVLEGSVQKIGDRVRITAQLIDAQNSRHLWAKKYDRELIDIFVLKDEITKKITIALEVKLTEGEGPHDWSETHSFEAYIKLKQALEYYRRFTPDDNILSRQQAKEALTLDPNYMPAMVMLAWTILTDVPFGTSNSIEKSIEQAFELAQHALKIGGESANTYFLIGFIHRMKGQFEKAVAELQKAHALCLNCADISAGLGMTLNDAGRPEEAMQILKNALRLNPIPPSWYYYQIGNAYRMTGKYEKALREYKKAIQVQPDNFLAHLGLAVAYVYLGREKEARAAAEEVLRINPKFSVELYAKSVPASNETAWQREMDALRKAGLPE